MAGSHRRRAKEQEAREIELVKTATATLTFTDLRTYDFIVYNSSSGGTLTIPAATAAMAGMSRQFAAKGSADLTISVAAGFGGSATTTVTVSQGETAQVVCDGSYWYTEAMGEDVTVTGTTADSFEINSDGNGLTISSSGLGSDRTITNPDASGEIVLIAATQTLTAKTLTTPTISGTGFTNAQHNHAGATSGGTLSSIAGLTGTTETTFTLASGESDGKIAFTVVGGGTDHTLTLINTVTTADITLTWPNATDTLVGRATTDTLTNKTLTQPVISAPTMTGAWTITNLDVTGTWVDLGIVSDVDINGGSIDGATVGAASASTGAFTTLSTAGTATIADLTVGGGYGSTGVTISAAGVVEANGALTTGGAMTAASIVGRILLLISSPQP